MNTKAIRLHETPVFAPNKVFSEESLVENIAGELLWHDVTSDPDIDENSRSQLSQILPVINDIKSTRKSERTRVLELASYCNITGYYLTRDHSCDVTLSDISSRTLQRGWKLATEILGHEIANQVDRYALDFHALPFEDDAFDLVYISSALHHTWNWKKVLSEMLRVLSPGGSLHLLNEPILREMCLYGFRTNRVGELDSQEQHLADKGLLTTFGEPYLGSKAEALFGMVENQTMELDDLVGHISQNSQNVIVTYTTIDGPFEQTLMSLKDRPIKEIEHHIRSELSDAINAVQHGPNQSKSVPLPSPAELNKFALNTAQKLYDLGKTKDTTLYQAKLAKLFGADIKLTATKKGQPLEVRGPIVTDTYEDVIESVKNAYPETVKQITSIRKHLIPDVQLAKINELEQIFPPNQWAIDHTPDHNIRYIHPISGDASFEIKAKAGLDINLLMRLYLHHGGEDYRIALHINDEPATYFDVYKSDSILLRAQKRVEKNPVKISFHIYAANSYEAFNSPVHYNIPSAIITQ